MCTLLVGEIMCLLKKRSEEILYPSQFLKKQRNSNHRKIKRRKPQRGNKNCEKKNFSKCPISKKGKALYNQDFILKYLFWVASWRRPVRTTQPLADLEKKDDRMKREMFQAWSSTCTHFCLLLKVLPGAISQSEI